MGIFFGQFHDHGKLLHARGAPGGPVVHKDSLFSLVFRHCNEYVISGDLLEVNRRSGAGKRKKEQ
jgi:hypothetical protein